MIRNFCLDILNSGHIQRLGREKRRGAVEDVESRIYETDPGTNILTVSSRYALYVSVIFGKPEVHPIFRCLKTFYKYNPPDFNFYPRKLTN